MEGMASLITRIRPNDDHSFKKGRQFQWKWRLLAFSCFLFILAYINLLVFLNEFLCSSLDSYNCLLQNESEFYEIYTFLCILRGF